VHAVKHGDEYFASRHAVLSRFTQFCDVRRYRFALVGQLVSIFQSGGRTSASCLQVLPERGV